MPRDRARTSPGRSAPASLDSLQGRLEAHAAGTGEPARWRSHTAVQDRLAGNIQQAEATGWTDCAIERRDGAERFTAWGVPPGESTRHPVPDRSAPQR